MWKEVTGKILRIAGKALADKEVEKLKGVMTAMESDHTKMCEAFAAIHDAMRVSVDGDQVEFGDGAALRDTSLARSVLWARQHCKEEKVPIQESP